MSVSGSAAFEFELLLPRLGEYLLEEGLISPQNLQQALDYQQNQKEQGQNLLLGQALLTLGLIDEQSLDRAVARQILDLHQALQTANRQLEEKVHQRTMELQHRLVQIRTAAEITQFAVAASSLEELFRRVVNLIVERFGYYSASIFLVDASGEHVVLVEAAGPFGQSVKERGQIIPVGSRSIVGWVAAYNQPRVSGNVREEFFYRIDDLLTETRSEAALPISLFNYPYQDDLSSGGTTSERKAQSDRVIGVLDVQDRNLDAFDPDAVAVLQTIANHIAAVIQNVRLLELVQQRLKETNALLELSARLVQAKTLTEVYTVVAKTLIELSYPSLLLVAQEAEFRIFHLIEERAATMVSIDKTNAPQHGEVQLKLQYSQFEALFQAEQSYVVIDTRLPTTYPQTIISLIAHLGWDQAVLIPVRALGQLMAIVVLGATSRANRLNNYPEDFRSDLNLRQRGQLDIETPVIEQCIHLARLMSEALERVLGGQLAEGRLMVVESVQALSQLISENTDLNGLYRRIHQEGARLIGDADFLIAIYEPGTNTIRVPYMAKVQPQGENSAEISIPPFPVGTDLVSRVVIQKQPVLIYEDGNIKAQELGAMAQGEPAKSWLGVPMMLGGECIGAIVVQDRFREGRFTPQNQSLLSAFANQVAVIIRNALLLENASLQAERERKLMEITSKLRKAADLESIIQITASELRKTFGFKRARIDIDVDTALPITLLDNEGLKKPKS